MFDMPTAYYNWLVYDVNSISIKVFIAHIHSQVQVTLVLHCILNNNITTVYLIHTLFILWSTIWRNYCFIQKIMLGHSFVFILKWYVVLHRENPSTTKSIRHPRITLSSHSYTKALHRQLVCGPQNNERTCISLTPKKKKSLQKTKRTVYFFGMWFRSLQHPPAVPQLVVKGQSDYFPVCQTVRKASPWFGIAAAPWFTSPAELVETAAGTRGTIVETGVSWAWCAWLVPCVGGDWASDAPRWSAPTASAMQLNPWSLGRVAENVYAHRHSHGENKYWTLFLVTIFVNRHEIFTRCQ